ncbi:MAG: lipopolysaccharide biosynthesis protein [Planctomycetes bacterium]|nr:lipopolysaccharide biosynthesis protein [Planctomycetota bacterium]
MPQTIDDSKGSMRSELKHSIVLMVGTGATAGLSLAYSVFAGRVLGPREFADFAAAIALATFCYTALGPINGTVARFTAQFAARGELGRIRTLSNRVTRGIACYGPLGLVIALAFVPWLRTILRFDTVWPLLIAGGMVFLNVLLNVPRGVLRGAQSFGSYCGNILFEAVTRLLIGIVALLLVADATAGLSAYVGALVLTLILSRRQLGRVWGDSEALPVEGAEVIRYAIPMFILLFATAGLQNIDMLFVKHYFAAAEAGHYGAALTLGRAVNVLVTPFQILMLPLLTGRYERGRGIVAPFVRVCSYFLILAAGLLTCFWLWPNRIMVLLFDTEYVAAAPLLLPLAGLRLAGFLCYLMGLAAAAMNRFRILWAYLPALIIEALALLIWHDSMMTVVTVALIVQITTLVPMAVILTLSMRAASPPRYQGDQAPAEPGGVW